uniref:Uncharacterized LOC100182200 n=1 Tax=Ciona intestinalis TaxID=7719 RepID=F6UV26_CIOIN|nr:uncharacterized protein LOC100182200 [Ciona intestinalis]|eukprot:XP_002122889.1 uncharacterized protein LOC100182200 [Ciona intestinalis]
MRVIASVTLFCFALGLVSATEVEMADMKSLQEVIDAATSTEVDTLYNGKSSSIHDMLVIVKEKTNIEASYLDKVFVEASSSRNVQELKKVMLDMTSAVDFINEVIKHFQANPMAGRKIRSDEL